VANAGCASVSRAVGRGGGCAAVPGPAATDVQTAINALGPSSPLGQRLRSLVEAPFQSDSLRSRVRLVADDSLCRAAGATALRWRARDRYAVFQLGNTYWVRGTSWGAVNALDTKLARIETFVDQ